MSWDGWLRFGLGIAVLVGVAIALLRLHQVPLGRAPAVAIL